jgi:amidophosphoribosyltransferase
VHEKSEVNIASKISQSIGADFVGYNDTSNLSKAIGLPEEELCFTCSTGDYSPLGIKPIFKSREEMKGHR